VAAIAFGRRAVVVDAKVERVVARLFASEAPLPCARGAIRTATDSVTPDVRAGDFAQAMMDLGATICTVRAPRCLLCPLASFCAGRARGNPEGLPVKAPKKAKPVRQGRAFWIERTGPDGEVHVLLVTRPGKGMLGGRRALPDEGWNARADGHGAPPAACARLGFEQADWRAGGVVRHGFTHFDLELHLVVAVGQPDCRVTAMPGDDAQWWPRARIADAGLPTVFAKAAQLALA
jgi:A/G-specific adenine glycosylase